MQPGEMTVLSEIKNWLEDYAPADLIEKCAASIEAHIQERPANPLSAHKHTVISLFGRVILEYIRQKPGQQETCQICSYLDDDKPKSEN